MACLNRHLHTNRGAATTQDGALHHYRRPRLISSLFVGYCDFINTKPHLIPLALALTQFPFPSFAPHLWMRRLIDKQGLIWMNKWFCTVNREYTDSDYDTA